LVSTKVLTHAATPLKTTSGSSGLELPEIGLGTWRYSGGTEPLRAGIDHGATLIDSAEIYGTEDVVGEAIRGRRSEVFLATKFAPRNFRRDGLIAAAENSLRRLGTDYIDLYQLHWPNYKVPIEESMAAMDDLVAAGKIRFIGVSNFSISELRRAKAVSRHDIVSNQVRYSLVERTIEDGLLQYCQQHGIAVIAYSPLGMSFPRIKTADPHGVLAGIACANGKTEAQVALNWLVVKDNVLAIPRASTVAHAIEDCGASGWRLTEKEYRLLDEKIQYSRRGSVRSALARCKRYAAQSIGRQL
jgi:diketogulonate reductase-like aldo/keto reductase